MCARAKLFLEHTARVHSRAPRVWVVWSICSRPGVRAWPFAMRSCILLAERGKALRHASTRRVRSRGLSFARTSEAFASLRLRCRCRSTSKHAGAARSFSTARDVLTAPCSRRAGSTPARIHSDLRSELTGAPQVPGGQLVTSLVLAPSGSRSARRAPRSARADPGAVTEKRAALPDRIGRSA